MNIFGKLPSPKQIVFADAVKGRALSNEVAVDGTIEALWKSGLDTYSIAKTMMLRESLVANRLTAIRDGRSA